MVVRYWVLDASKTNLSTETKEAIEAINTKIVLNTKN